MRVTQNMMTRNYMSGLQKSQADLNKYSRQVYTGRRFERMSEDTSAAVRAMQVRQKMDRIPSYISNAQSTLSHLGAAETNLLQISREVSEPVHELWVKAMNGTNGPDEHSAIRSQMENLQQQLLTLANGQFAGKYLFGGTNTITRPFTVDDNGRLMYNNELVSGLTSTHALFSDAAHVDIGLGIERDANGNIISNSVFKSTLVGLEFMGTDPNLYDLMTDMINMLNNGIPNKEAGDALLDRFLSASTNTKLMMTTIGADVNYLEFTIDRLETDMETLIERQDQLEFIPPEEAILYFKMQEFVYNAALQMGQRLLQPTLFSFIN